MADPSWGMLAKALDDPQTINEAINEAIAAHEADSEAHLGAGESLETHRASEVIDHLEESIVNDKYLDGSVTPEKTLATKYKIQPTFESLDGWATYLSGAGGSVTSKVGTAKVMVGNAVGNLSELFMDISWGGAIVGSTDKDFILQMSIVLNEKAYCDAGWGWGNNNMVDGGYRIGFRWSDSDSKLYAAIKEDGQAEIKEEITGINPDLFHYYRIEWNNTTKTATFYVDDVEVSTITDAGFVIDSDYAVACTVKNTSAGQTPVLYITNLIHIQNH